MLFDKDVLGLASVGLGSCALFDGVASPSVEVGEHRAGWVCDVARQVRARTASADRGRARRLTDWALPCNDVDDVLCVVAALWSSCKAGTFARRGRDVVRQGRALVGFGRSGSCALFDGVASLSVGVGEHRAWWAYDVARQVRARTASADRGRARCVTDFVPAREDVDGAFFGKAMKSFDKRVPRLA